MPKIIISECCELVKLYHKIINCSGLNFLRHTVYFNLTVYSLCSTLDVRPRFNVNFRSLFLRGNLKSLFFTLQSLNSVYAREHRIGTVGMHPRSDGKHTKMYLFTVTNDVWGIKRAVVKLFD